LTAAGIGWILFELRRLAIIGLTVALSVAAGSGVALATPKPLPLSARVIQRGELPGFGPFRSGGNTKLFKSARQWVSGNTSLMLAQASAQIARLRREGFKAVLVEQLGSLKPQRGGLSWVMQLGSSASARAELAAAIRDTRNQNSSSYTAFSVRTIPGARGFHAGGSFVGDNIFFADGPFLYLVGNGWAQGVKDPPQRSNLIAAATKLYTRVRDHPPV
jgi:hypothetical protein